jgi:molybdopterin/thiamine biosynthesis adenylyltransferase
LKVTLIGCGGIGANFAETLARLGVKNWTLIDPDILETVNLNRMIAATPLMVKQNWYKVDYVKYLIKRSYPQGSSVKTLPTVINPNIEPSLIRESDLIVIATDNHYSRQIAQELALKYHRPLLCLGTHIEVKSDKTPRMYCRITIPPLGGNWCLMCANIINLQRAALEISASEIHQLATEAGYIQDVPDPAVLWLNNICASTAVGIIHGIIIGLIDVTHGLDWIYDFNNCHWLKTNPETLLNSDCYFCSRDNF